MIGSAEKAAARRTFHIIETAKKPRKAAAALWHAMRHPCPFAKAVSLAWRMRAPGLRALVYQGIYLAEAMVLAWHLRRTGCGHVHTHFANSSATVGVLAARLAGTGFSFTLHGPSDLFEAKYWRLDTKISEARFVACISHFARSQAMLHADPDQWHKLRIVHCGVVPELYGMLPPANPEAGLRLVFVGRLAPVKGLRILLDAFDRAREARPDMHLTIIGDGPDRAELECLAAPLEAAVTFTGALSQADVAARLAAADALVLPSFAEGVPVVLMEAMASGKPVIATRVAGVSELVEDGISGYLVPPGDVETLTARLLDLANDPDCWAEMGRAGREKVVRDFDIRREAARLARLFQDEGGETLRLEGSSGNASVKDPASNSFLARQPKTTTPGEQN
ncbi:glycosyltransferase family 4 protein [uncultured Jannaschia sp.]|uniref:glycosyltransferase family 4 protein n=1 Tax=uncultured Jannaschia sp. TaxID=293347 RepID=UPI002637D1AB|nr:glycosyltransferase family 4 protein [uncultured Jannaschia sp.]